MEFQICVTTLVWFCLCFDRHPKMCSLVHSSINLCPSTYCQDVLVQPHPEGIMTCLLTNQKGFSPHKAILQQNPTSVSPHQQPCNIRVKLLCLFEWPVVHVFLARRDNHFSRNSSNGSNWEADVDYTLAKLTFLNHKTDDLMLWVFMFFSNPT